MTMFRIILTSALAVAFSFLPAFADGPGFYTTNPQFPNIEILHDFPPDPVSPGGVLKGEIMVKIPEGWHVYAPGVEKYRKLNVEKGEGPLSEVRFHYPEGQIMDVVGEQVPVYDGIVSIAVEGKIREDAEAGKTVWRPLVSWQSCSDNLCLAPESRTLEIHLTIDKKS